MKYILFICVAALVASCMPQYDPAITKEDIQENIAYLASDSLKGRKAGEQGDLLAAEFIRDKFQKAGLELLYDQGFQSFGLVTSAELADGNFLKVNDKALTVEEDFLPYAFSANTTVNAPLVFAGYGLSVNKDTLVWEDYAGIDVKGKWVLALQGDPDLDNAQSPFLEFSSERSKALQANDNQAAGLILVAGTKFSENDVLSSLFFDKNSSRYSIPVLQVTRATANEILKESGETIESLENRISESGKTVHVDINSKVEVQVNVSQKEALSQNVVAMVPGNDEVLKNEYIVVGAHYDHLGMGGPGSGSRAVDTVAVHNGADDNASGVAVVVQMAEKLAKENNNKRSVIFTAFGAEEMGLVGSKAFTANAPVETDNMVAMFNFDMVGRLDTVENVLSVGGSKTAVETEELFSRLNDDFKITFSPEGVGPSDHASFYLQDIPVFFISTGAHSDYHTPVDDPDKLNLDGIVKIAKYSYKVMDELSNRNEKLTFQESGPKFQRSRGGRFKVTFGIMPDYAGIEKRGMRIDAVTKGRPAAKGGMQKGDIITAIEGKKVGNIYDYMSRLQTLEAGQTVSVDIIRGDTETVLIIQL